MEKLSLNGFRLGGLKLRHQTTNDQGRSSADCGALWQQFETEQYADRIPDKLTEEIYAVYFDYKGDHTQPFSYFIGCRIKEDAVLPDELDSITLPPGQYAKIVAKGKMPDCIANTWKAIWESGMSRKYAYDFEVYDHRSKDWNQAEVDVYLSL